MKRNAFISFLKLAIFTLIAYTAYFIGISYNLQTQKEQIANAEIRNLQTLPNITQNIYPYSFVPMALKAHTLALFIIWGGLIDVSIICVRYFKAYKKYLRFHASVMALGNLISLIVIFVEIGQRSSEINNLSDQTKKEGAHFVIGILMLIAIVVQHLLGMITKLNFENEDGSQSVHTIKRVHKVFFKYFLLSLIVQKKILGYLIYIIAKINVIIGVDMFEKKYYSKQSFDDYWWQNNSFIRKLLILFCIERAKALGGFYTIQIIILLTIEFFYRQESRAFISITNKTKKADAEKEAVYKNILEMLNDHRPISEINAQIKGVLFVILENKVYDISEIQHPGGQFIFKHIKGKEISRYFNGGYECEETTMSPYRHTLYANSFINKFLIGEIQSDYYNIIAPFNAPLPEYASEKGLRNLQQSDPAHNQNENKSLQTIQQTKKNQLLHGKMLWNLEETREITDAYKVFLFSNNDFKIRTYLPGVRWFGKSVVLQPQIDSVKIHPRNYSVVLSYIEENYKYRLDLIRYFQNKMQNDIGISSIPPIPSPFSTHLPLLIKKHNSSKEKNGLSQFLHLDVHKLYYISNPIGHGLEIDENSDGEHIIFTAGTGILPFLDLFEYMLKKLIFIVIKERYGPQEAALINPHNENYEASFGPNFRIKLYCAFTSKAECYGYQIISDLFTFCNQYLQNSWFSVMARFANQESDQILTTTKQYFDSQFIDVALQQTFPTKIMICGPPAFNKNISNILISTRGIDPSRVQII